jgi:hypothetical protein
MAGKSLAASDQSSADKEIVVFSITRESKCAECGTEIWKGSLLRMEEERPLCLTCADLDRLIFFLPRGNTGLTRRASKHSMLHAVVVRFSRARKRYERQGILVEEAALKQAERECLADAEARERARERASQRRNEHDVRYVREFAERIGELFPRCPVPERQAIADRACLKYSGRIGRSAAAQDFDPKAIELAVRAHVRHCHTEYDEKLASGMDRMDARDVVREQVEDVVGRWRAAVDLPMEG